MSSAIRLSRILARLLIATLLLGLLASCVAPAAAPTNASTDSADAEAPVTLSVMFEYQTADHKQGTEELLADFQEAHPNINLDIQSALQQDAPTILQTRLAANDAPDVLFTVPSRVPILIRDDLLTDITSYLPAGYREAFEPNLLAETSDDKIFGFPLSLGIRAVAYNADLFEQAGIEVPSTADAIWTWDEMVAAATQVKEATGIPYGLQFEKPSFDGWLPFLFQNGGSLVSADGTEATINDAAGVAAIQWTIDLHESGLAAPGILEGGEDPLRTFASGQSALWLATGSFMVPGMENQIANFEYGFTLMPKQVQPSTVTFGNDIVMMKTEHPDEAWALINYVTSAENISRISNSMGNFPSRADAQNVTFARQDLVPIFQEQAKMVGVEMSQQMLMPFYGASRDRLLRELQAATSGQKSAQAAADEMAQIIEGELNK